jgi:hypothetical protein
VKHMLAVTRQMDITEEEMAIESADTAERE